MAKKEFILQGFTTRTHLAAVREMFDVADIKRVIFSVAFVNESGVQLLEDKLNTHGPQLVVYAGVRNEISSHQGIAKLHSIKGSAIYTVDTGARHFIFHPKIYLVRGSARARLIVGSANLTIGGLHNNVEAGLILDLDLADTADKSLVNNIENGFLGLPKAHPKNVEKITGVAQLDQMLTNGRIVDENAERPPRPSKSGSGGAGGDSIPRLKMKLPALRSALRKGTAPAKRPTSASGTKGRVATSNSAPATVGTEFELVWESKELTRRDLTIPTAPGTHATGSINLDKGLLPEDVDHRPYFRDIVFPALTWMPHTVTTEEAYAKFQLVLRGIGQGEFDLAIRHSTSKTSKTYLQRNAMTRLSWGPMHDFIARPDLIGRTLSLSRDKADPTRFMIEID